MSHPQTASLKFLAALPDLPFRVRPSEGFQETLGRACRALVRRGALLLLMGMLLLAGVGMTWTVDRLETAARARAGLEQQTAALQQRLLPADPTVPALQQVRDSYDRAIGQAADLARGGIWASLALVAAALAWMERRGRGAGRAGRVEAAQASSLASSLVLAPAERCPQVGPQVGPQGDEGLMFPAAVVSTSAGSEHGERLGDIAREMRALRDWMAADPQCDAPAPQHRHQEAAVRSVRFHLAA